MKLRRLIKNFRKQLGLTQGELAKKLTVKQNYIWMIENGRASPGRSFILNFAELTGLNPRYILNILISDKKLILERRLLG